MTNAIFAISICLAIWFTTVNVVLICNKMNVSAANFAIMSMSITAIITHIIGIW